VDGIAAAEFDDERLLDDSGAIPFVIKAERTSAIGSAT
jgi:hypothetical protein